MISRICETIPRIDFYSYVCTPVKRARVSVYLNKVQHGLDCYSVTTIITRTRNAVGNRDGKSTENRPIDPHNVCISSDPKCALIIIANYLN